MTFIGKLLLLFSILLTLSIVGILSDDSIGNSATVGPLLKTSSVHSGIAIRGHWGLRQGSPTPIVIPKFRCFVCMNKKACEALEKKLKKTTINATLSYGADEQVCTNTTQKCMSVFNKQGASVQRGCLEENAPVTLYFTPNSDCIDKTETLDQLGNSSSPKWNDMKACICKQDLCWNGASKGSYGKNVKMVISLGIPIILLVGGQLHLFT